MRCGIISSWMRKKREKVLRFALRSEIDDFGGKSIFPPFRLPKTCSVDCDSVEFFAFNIYVHSFASFACWNCKQLGFSCEIFLLLHFMIRVFFFSHSQSKLVNSTFDMERQGVGGGCHWLIHSANHVRFAVEKRAHKFTVVAKLSQCFFQLQWVHAWKCISASLNRTCGSDRNANRIFLYQSIACQHFGSCTKSTLTRNRWQQNRYYLPKWKRKKKLIKIQHMPQCIAATSIWRRIFYGI